MKEKEVITFALTKRDFWNNRSLKEELSFLSVAKPKISRNDTRFAFWTDGKSYTVKGFTSDLNDLLDYMKEHSTIVVDTKDEFVELAKKLNV